MTVLSLSPAVRKVLSGAQDDFFESASPVSPGSDHSRAVPRINLRKRPHSSSSRQDLPCVTSAFLTNLFADAEKASAKETRCSKKTRLTKTKSHKSFVDFLDPSEGSVSPVTAITDFFNDQANLENEDTVNCIATSSDASSAADIFTFPNLPAAVSNTSCSTSQSLTSVTSDQQTSETDTPSKESYGWFVETDRNIKSSFAHEDSAYGSLSPSSAEDLAFSVNTAPKANKLDAEVEWAKAADTVDDVLGDFF